MHGLICAQCYSESVSQLLVRSLCFNPNHSVSLSSRHEYDSVFKEF